MNEQPIKLTVGGIVQPNRGIYLKRPADDELLAACLAHEFAYVLACRQIGKSSLMIATAERLIEQGIRVALIDLNSIGQVTEAEIWYFSLLDELARRLQLSTDVDAWWDHQPRLSSFTQRFLRFFDEVVLTEISQPVVIFIDEIDITLGLPFTDDFFAAIRAVHHERAQYLAYRRLTFVLIGVATPDELIDDHKRTPFNIGRVIPIRDFTLAECAPLRLAIEAKHPEQSEPYFQQIYSWTSGHPYLTQKLCAIVTNTAQTDKLSLVNDIVDKYFLADKERIDPNIRFVQSRVLGDPHAAQMLRTYKQILQGKTVLDNEKSLAINRLKLYGLVVAEAGQIKARNKIYTEIFDLRWVNHNINRKKSHLWRLRWVPLTLRAALPTATNAKLNN